MHVVLVLGHKEISGDDRPEISGDDRPEMFAQSVRIRPQFKNCLMDET
jgi:hypothetical protein